MEYVFLIFGTLIALNIGLVTSLSEPNETTWNEEARVEIETMVNETDSSDDFDFTQPKVELMH